MSAVSQIRKIRAWGPALVVAFLLSGFAASSALASTPTFQTESGGVEVPFAISGEGGAMETVGGNRVECDETEGTGEIVNATRVSIAELRFKGCADVATGATCTTDEQPAGDILTKPGNADLRYTGPNGNIAALWVWPQSGDVLAEFSCTIFGIGPDVTAFATAGEDKGGFVCPITPVNEFSTTSTVVCNQEGGEQEFKAFADPTNCLDVPDWFESVGEGPIGGWNRQESALEGEVMNSTAPVPVRINSTECV